MVGILPIYRYLLLFAFLLGSISAAFAGEINYVKAQRIYEWFVAGKGDSIHAELSSSIREKLSPEMFKDAFKQSENMFGKLISKNEWKTESVRGIEVYYSDLEFERGKLRFLLAFDADGSINTLRIMPVPEVQQPQLKTYDRTKMDEREIVVGAEEFKLPGTLTLPKISAAKQKTHKVPCVILLHGSGPNDRDETVGPNKPFRDFAWGLAERGIAVVRYDKRTKVYGAACVSAGRDLDYDTEVVDDAVAAVSQIMAIPEIAADSVYLLGHSLGGTLAPRIALRSRNLAGIIILAGLARPLEDALGEQCTYVASLSDSSADTTKQLAELQIQLLNVKRLGTRAFDDKIALPLNLPRSYWALANTYKPVKTAAKLNLPMFIIQGERDYQVTMEDFALWRSGLWNRKNVIFKSYSELNHLLQEGTGKSTPFEYNQAISVPEYVCNDVSLFVRGINPNKK